MTARTISHFEIGERIGEGGIGVVHRGRDINLDRPVAVKFLHSHLLNSLEAVRRFRREARVLSNLSHPNIATVFEVGEEDEQQFIVLECLPGGSLSSKIRDLRAAGLLLSMRQVVDMALQIAEGLGYAHRQGIIHRDIKPGNILCTLDGKLKVTDFGLAMFVRSADSTMAARVEGTIPYMAPEQIKGREANPRSDIYSFGVTIFELATGDRAYSGPNDAAVMHSILHDPVPSIHRWRPDVIPELDQLVRRAMAKDPADRPARFAEISAELASIREKCPVSQEIPSSSIGDSRTLPITAPIPKNRRLPWREIAFVVLVLLVAGASAGASRVWSMRCLVARGWFDGCSIPARKEIGVLKVPAVSKGGDEVLAAGMRDYMIGQLSRLARFESQLCVHSVDVRSRLRAVNLSLEPRLIYAGATPKFAAELWRVQSELQLDRMVPVAFSGASFQDRLVQELARLLSIRSEERMRRAMAAGSTGIAEAFQSYISGLGRLSRNQLDEAIADFRKAVAEDSYYASAYAGLAEAYRRKYHSSHQAKLMDLALESASAAKARDGELPEGRLSLGRVHYDLGQYDKAVEELRHAVALTPANSEIRYELVDACMALGQPATARAVAEEGVKLYPDCFMAQHDLASFYRSLGHFNEAERHYRRVVDLAPKSSVAHSNLAGTLYDQQEYTEAEQQWREALSLQPTSTAYTNLGQLYIRTNCFAAAERALEQATAIARDDFLAYGNLGEAFHLLPEHKVREQGLFAKALKLAQQERVDNPSDPQLARMVAFYHARLGDKRSALETIQEAIDLAPDNIHTLYRAAFLYEISGERDRALPVLDRVVKAGYQTRELCTHPDLNGLRADPRFLRLLGGKCAPYDEPAHEGFSCPGMELTHR